MPALPGGHGVEIAWGETGAFGGSQYVFNMYAGIAIETLCLLQQRLRFVETGDDAAPCRESAGDIAGAGAQIEHMVAGFYDSGGEQAVKKAIRVAGAVA